MPVDPISTEEEAERNNDRHILSLLGHKKANKLVRYYPGAEAAADAAGIP